MFGGDPSDKVGFLPCREQTAVGTWKEAGCRCTVMGEDTWGPWCISSWHRRLALYETLSLPPSLCLEVPRAAYGDGHYNLCFINSQAHEINFNIYNTLLGTGEAHAWSAALNWLSS